MTNHMANEMLETLGYHVLLPRALLVHGRRRLGANDNRRRLCVILTAMAMSFATLLVVANIVAVKPVALNGWVLPAGTIAYPFTFLITDTISELYGRRIATRVVWFGFGLSAAMVVMVYVAQVLPSADFWEDQGAFETILGSVPRIVLGVNDRLPRESAQ